MIAVAAGNIVETKHKQNVKSKKEEVNDKIQCWTLLTLTHILCIILMNKCKTTIHLIEIRSPRTFMLLGYNKSTGTVGIK